MATTATKVTTATMATKVTTATMATKVINLSVDQVYDDGPGVYQIVEYKKGSMPTINDVIDEVMENPGYPDCFADDDPDPDKVCHATVAAKHPTFGKYQGKHAIYLRGFGADYVPVNPDGLEWNVYGDMVVLEGLIKHRTDPTKVFYARISKCLVSKLYLWQIHW